MSNIKHQSGNYELDAPDMTNQTGLVRIKRVHGTDTWNAWLQLKHRRGDKTNHLRLLGTWNKRPTLDQVLGVLAFNTGITACGGSEPPAA